ncbi:MAG: YifB family Mg chelatase-like AAA ATPase [Actinobacteria bacterium]|nr:YifB family Mg chelatase-like AAA ATPase [Actinomycetota bacterium]
MLGQCLGIALLGLDGQLVSVEVDIADGLPGYTLLGLPDTALTESKDRVRSALVNSGEIWPNKKVTVSLSPAWLPKSGSGFDLPIAIALLSAHGGIPEGRLNKTLFIGELSLDGRVQGVRGVLPSLIAAYKCGITVAVVPLANRLEAELMTEMKIISVGHLREVLMWLRTGESLRNENLECEYAPEDEGFDFSDVAGQPHARLAAEVSAVGGHHLLLIGPPGAGKTMIAQRLPGILPRLSRAEVLEVSAVHSLSRSHNNRSPLSSVAPFVAPHHTATRVAMVGGGSSTIRPGACSLAHRGVLFIDEAPECGAGVLDALRQPLEAGSISIARSIGSVSYPAQFILILAANPCPCGKFSGRGRGCTCSSLQVRRYLGKLSGPLMDRIDLRVEVEPLSRLELVKSEYGDSSATIAERVSKARSVAAHRFNHEPWSLNAQIPSRALQKKYVCEKSAISFLHTELDAERLTGRGLHKVMRIAWSLADLALHPIPTLGDIRTALRLREGSTL